MTTRTAAQPATPLPWDIRKSYSSEDGTIDPLTYKSPGYYDNKGIYSPSSGKWPVACDEYEIFETGQDAAYIVHAANAYPKLVEQLKLEMRSCEPASAAYEQLRSLLRSLGELE